MREHVKVFLKSIKHAEALGPSIGKKGNLQSNCSLDIGLILSVCGSEGGPQLYFTAALSGLVAVSFIIFRIRL